MFAVALAGCSKKAAQQEAPAGSATADKPPVDKPPAEPPAAAPQAAAADDHPLAPGVNRNEFCTKRIPDAVLAKYKLKRVPVTGPDNEDMVICEAEIPGGAGVGFMYRCNGGFATEPYLTAEAEAAKPYTEVTGIGTKAYTTKENVLFLSGPCQVIMTWLGGNPKMVDLARDVAAAQPK
jgi:hypothetical protein